MQWNHSTRAEAEELFNSMYTPISVMRKRAEEELKSDEADWVTRLTSTKSLLIVYLIVLPAIGMLGCGIFMYLQSTL
jgi:hypothetical protein